MILYVVQPRELWGDYGAALINGTCVRGNDKLLTLNRTGPFVPPFFMPWDRPIIGNGMRNHVLALELPGIRLCRTRYGRIVELHWHTWDLAASEPQQYPKSGEPEGYLWDEWPELGPDDLRMESAWELIVPEEPYQVRREHATKQLTLVDAERTEVPPISTNGHYTLVNEATKKRLEAIFGDWMNFERVTTERNLT
jgi:hypothetical protein